MTLSSRDPHLGQRIVWRAQLPYHCLWCQRFFDGLCGIGARQKNRREDRVALQTQVAAATGTSFREKPQPSAMNFARNAFRVLSVPALLSLSRRKDSPR